MTLPLRERCREQVRALDAMIDGAGVAGWLSDAYVLRDLLRACDRRIAWLEMRYLRDIRWCVASWDRADALEAARALGPWPKLRYMSAVLGMLATSAPVPPAAIREDDDCEGLGVRG